MRLATHAAAALTLVSFIAVIPARGGVVAGDHFNLSPIGTQATNLGTGVYTGGSALVGSGPAVTGFNSGTNWAGSTITETFVTPSGDGLNYTDSNGLALPTSGGLVQYTGPSGVSTSLDRVTRATNDATSRTTYYASSLVNVGSFANTTDQGLLEFKFSLSTYVQFGLRNKNAVILNGTGGSVSSSQTASAATTSNAYTAGTTHLLVLKIVGQAGGNDNVSLFIDPTDLSTESGTTLNVTNGLALLPDAGDKLSLVGLYGGRTLGTGNSAYFDELRFGTTWADVVPEPSLAAVCSPAAAVVLLLSRRRRSRQD